MNNTLPPLTLSRYAQAYTSERVGAVRRSPTWEDVAIAYDAGLRQGVEAHNRRQLQTYIRALYVVNSPQPDTSASAS